MILLAGLTGAAAGAVSMAAGAYLSSKAEREIFDRELREEAAFAQREPYLAAEGVLVALEKEGLRREEAYRVVRVLHSEKSAFVKTFQEKVLGLGTADIARPKEAAAVMGLSFALGSLVPLVPYAAVPGRPAVLLSVLLAGAALVGVGVFKGALARVSLLRSAGEFFLVAVGASVLGYGIGKVLEAM